MALNYLDSPDLFERLDKKSGQIKAQALKEQKSEQEVINSELEIVRNKIKKNISEVIAHNKKTKYNENCSKIPYDEEEETYSKVMARVLMTV